MWDRVRQRLRSVRFQHFMSRRRQALAWVKNRQFYNREDALDPFKNICRRLRHYAAEVTGLLGARLLRVPCFLTFHVAPLRLLTSSTLINSIAFRGLSYRLRGRKKQATSGLWREEIT